MRYQFISDEKKAYPVTLMCKILLVSRSGYYRWTKGGKSPRKLNYERLRPLIKEIHSQSKESYGARRIAEEL
jgi:putative transposase